MPGATVSTLPHSSSSRPRSGFGARGTRDVSALLREYAATRDLALRDELVLRHQRLVHYFALRLTRGGNATYDDLVQVGYLGLIAALDRFDPDQGGSFVAYAGPTIVGTIKRYLRDHTWFLKAPRRLRELGITLRTVRETLETRLGRAPTLSELTAETGVSEERIVEALDLERAYRPMSLDLPRTEGPEGESSCTWEAVGGRDPRLEAVEEKESLRCAITQLEEREQAIIYARFYGEATQTQIAEQLGISQMHVSRLERRALKQLRELLDSGSPRPIPNGSDPSRAGAGPRSPSERSSPFLG